MPYTRSIRPRSRSSHLGNLAAKRSLLYFVSWWFCVSIVLFLNLFHNHVDFLARHSAPEWEFMSLFGCDLNVALP